jgi:hypothetical protein
MNPLTNMNRRAAKAIAFAVAVIAIAMLVPFAQAKATAAERYGPLDPWAYAAIHRSPQATVTVIRLHRTAPVATGPAVDRIVDRPPYVSPSAKTVVAAPRSVNSGQPNGVDWRDAGIGAAGAFALMLLAVAVGFAMRKRGTLAHSRS